MALEKSENSLYKGELNPKLLENISKQIMIVRTILSSAVIFGCVLPAMLPKYRYIMNPQMDKDKDDIMQLEKSSLAPDASKAKHAQEQASTVHLFPNFSPTVCRHQS